MSDSSDNHDPQTAEDTDDRSLPDSSRREMLSAAVKFSGIMAGLGLCGQTLLASDEAHAAKQKLKKHEKIKKKDLPPIVDPKKLEGPGRPGAQVDGDALRSLLQAAFTGGSMAKAIDQWGPKTKLPPDVLDQLRQINDSDIKALSVVRQQLDASLNGIAVEAPWTVHEHATFRKKS